MTYAQLQTDILSLLNRPDQADKAPSWIKLAESEMTRLLKSSHLEKYTTLLLENGEAALPEDFLRMSNIELDGLDTPLRYLAPTQLDGIANEGGDARYYTIQGRRILIYPTVLLGIVKMRYRAKIDALSEAAPTNWLYNLSPDAYLYGSAKHGAIHVLDMEAAAAYSTAFTTAMATINIVANDDTAPAQPGFNPSAQGIV